MKIKLHPLTQVGAIAIACGFAAAGCSASDRYLPLQTLSFGAIADCQYADKDARGERLYRSCPGKLEAAVEELNSVDLQFVVHLGDFIEEDAASFAPLLDITRKLNSPLVHVLGNHDFSVADSFKPRVPQTLGLSSRYYTFAHGPWRFVVLDGTDVSTYAWPEDSEEHRHSMEMLEGRYQGKKRWNGGIGEAQLNWLEDVLSRADTDEEKVVILCHFGAYPENRHNLWNATDVLDVIGRHRSVVAWFNGHNHEGNYGQWQGVHFVNLVGMLETPASAYAVVHLSEHQIVVDGYGRQPDMTLPLR